MKILFFGAGPLGSFYAHLFHEIGEDVTVLARGERHDWIKANGLVLRNEITGQKNTSHVKVVNALTPLDEYDLAIVLIRKNKLFPVYDTLAASPRIRNILFMGNNASGFDDYVGALPAEKLIFGFPGAGGGIREQVVHYADREKPGGSRKSVTIGEIDGRTRERTLSIKSVFESAGVPVHVSPRIDGWLKYHVALVNPLVGALYKHDCDNYRAAKDQETMRVLVRAAKEGGHVLNALGFRKSQPFAFNLIYWLPEFMNAKAVRKLLESRFAEVAFAMHALAARDEMQDLARQFQELTARTSVATPNINTLRNFTL